MFEKKFSHNAPDSLDQTLKREIHLARNIQMKLLNGKQPVLENAQLRGSSIPARLIGGDYYDFYPLMNGKLRIVIGDVMGKGIPAAMLMILTRGAFRSAAEFTKGPGETLTAMNNALFEDLRSLGSFVTLLCADWDPKTGRLNYANAGHPLPLIIKHTKTILQVPKLLGVMLGGLPHQIYEEKEIVLDPKDCVYFYTDGIIEAQNRNGEQFKRDRLIQVLLENYEKSAEDLEKAVLKEILDFAQDTPQRDDITMVILKNDQNSTFVSGFNSPVMNY